MRNRPPPIPAGPYDEDEALRDPTVQLRPAFARAIEDARPVVAARFATWRDIPGLQPASEAFDERMKAVMAGKSERVDFKRTLMRFLKKRFPDDAVVSATSDRFRVVRTLNEKLALGINWWHKSGYGIGKLMHVEVGAHWDDRAAMVYYALPHFLGAADQADWAYITKEDLEACFEGAAAFLDVLLPPLAGALVTWMAEDSDLGGAGALTAREGYEIAARLADAALPDLELAKIMEMRGTGRIIGPLLSPDGRLRAHAMWGYFFSGPAKGARIDVPFLGAPVVNVGSAQVRAEPIGEPWIDSSEALAAVAASGRVPADAVVMSIVLDFARPYLPDACWRIDLIAPQRNARGVAWVDARDASITWHGM